jgi:hypothetical protein
MEKQEGVMATGDREYGVPNPVLTDREIPLVASNHIVPDVESAFARISIQADHLAAHDGDLFARKRKFRYTHVNRKGVNAARNHFQGLQRLRKGKYLVISGGDVTEAVSHLFIARMGSRRAKGPWGSNLLFSIRPDKSDRIVKTVPLNKKFWHAGGLSLLGDILAVPLESKTKSKIAFLHMLDPESPTFLDCDINRPRVGKAGAVALGTLTDGRVVCAVWREVGEKPKGRLDFYLSETDDIRDGFEEDKNGLANERKVVTWNYGSLELDEDRDPQYQCINFIEGQDKDAHNGVTRLYMVGTENRAAAAPLQGGPDLVDLFRVSIPNDMFGSPTKTPDFLRLNTRQFFCNREYCNFDAAAGTYIDAGGGLSLYASYHWRVDDTIRFAEFRCQPDDESVINDLEKAWIDLYENPHFTGRRLSILGTREANIDDYGSVFAQGHGFDNRVSSVQYQIPPGHEYRLYKYKFFRGELPDEDYIKLIGTGRVEEIPDFKTSHEKIADSISSSKYA